MRRPDIVLILADDLGYSDLGCYGGEISTPNIDRLGRSGARLTQFYNTARCSPSRASLLTGRHPHETGIGVLTRPDLPAGYAGNLSRDVPTVAETLRDNGYRTWMSGKWHLSARTDAPDSTWPTRRGFERFFGTLAGCGSYFDPQTLTRGEAPADDASNPDFYYTDAIAAEAVEWINEHAADAGDDPFFLYTAFTAPHWPLHARDDDLARTRGRFDDGWDELRQRRLQRLVDEGLLDPATELSPRDPGQPAWADTEDRAWQVRRMEAYAAQVESMDRGIGRIVDALERTGRLDNALIIFLADNGGSAEELPLGPMETFALKDRSMVEGTRSGHPVRIGNTSDIEPGAEDTYTSYGVPWANLSNTPFRRYKRWVHEGGISTPFIVHWPSGDVAPDTIVRDPYQLVHVVPTLLDAAGIPHGGSASMLESLQGHPVDSHPTLYWEHIGNAAIRREPWKLVRDHPSDWELYDVSTDRAELHDLAAEHSELVAELAEQWQEWARRVGVLPWEEMVERYVATGRSPAAAEE